MTEGLSGFELAPPTVLGVAVNALIYAMILARQMFRESAGSGKVKHVWNGIQTGANAYLRRQLRSVIMSVGVLGVFLYLSAALANFLPSKYARASHVDLSLLFPS